MKKIIVLTSALMLAAGQLMAQKITGGVLTIANGTTEIKNMAYYGRTDFNKVVIPSSVTKIGDLAFHNCSNLKEIDIPASVKTIGKAAFQNCTSLSKVTLHEGLTNLNYRAFKSTAIREISIPSTVTDIGNEVFADCKNLTKINTDRNPKAQKQLSDNTQSKKVDGTSGATNNTSNNSGSNGKTAANDGFIHVEGGTFTMGTDSGEEYERPAHRVTVSSFYISDHEVTQAEYKSMRYSNPSQFKDDNRPVEKVNWYDAIYYCNKLSIKKGLTPCYKYNGESNPDKWSNEYTNYYGINHDNNAVTCDWTANGYRLPTEAEWEFAARGGTKSKGYKYSGSNNIDDVAWYDNNSGNETHPVKQKKPNELGLYDMTGNVGEWVWDWYAVYPDGSETNPRGFSDGFYFFGAYVYRVNKGGSYVGNPNHVYISRRYGNITPWRTIESLGFRLVRNDPSADHTYRPAKNNPQKSGNDMVLVEGGTFRMGSTEGLEEEAPVHTVTVSSFYICDHEVTQAEFKEIMRINPSSNYNIGDAKPIDDATWYEAIIYCNLLSQAKGLKPCYSIKGNTNVRTWETIEFYDIFHQGNNWEELIECDFAANGYRLPTEAEWEFAARGGNRSKGYKYSGSNEIDEVCWYEGNCLVEYPGTTSFKTYHTVVREVKTKKSNELGLYDMSGNVCEWCWNRFEWYTSQNQTNPTGGAKNAKEKSPSYRVLRGGGHAYPGYGCTIDEAAARCTVTSRLLSYPDISIATNPGFGFRVVRTAK